MSAIELSEDQEVARLAVLEALAAGRKELTLSGPAGSGKTTLMRRLLADLQADDYTVRLVAPTGKAASRLAALTGQPATTIHSPLYKTITDLGGGGVEFSDPKAIADGRSVIICDEASMVGKRLYGDLRNKLPPSVALLCVGDREQLEPVNDTWGADFADPTALLTQIHRQAAGSPIIQLATAIRHGEAWRGVRPDGVAYRVVRASLADAAAWLALERAFGGDATLLTYTNRIRQRLNADVRAARGHVGALVPGDQIVCTRNNYPCGIMNGEVRQVVDFELIDASDSRLVRVTFAEGGPRPIIAPATLAGGPGTLEWQKLEALADAIDAESDDWEVFECGPLKKKMMIAEYGECLTVHKSQGSQWHSVGVILDSVLEGMEQRDPSAFRRLCYTAVTRAAKELVIFDVGRA